MNPYEFWIPVSMFIGLAVVLSLWVWFRYRAKRDVQETIRIAIEKGDGLSPETIENLVNPPVSRQRDLRRGVISVGVGIAIALFALFLDERDALGPLMGIAMFPMSIGAGFLLMHRFGRSG
jgi:hypothetical protein